MSPRRYGPGTGPALPEEVACSVFKYNHDVYWPGERRLFDVWINQGYAVDFEGYTNKGHAWAVNGCCMKRMLEYIARKKSVKILYPAVVISLVRLSYARHMRAYVICGGLICGHMSYTSELIMNRTNNEPN